jgi:hypothetical protein
MSVPVVAGMSPSEDSLNASHDQPALGALADDSIPSPRQRSHSLPSLSFVDKILTSGSDAVTKSMLLWRRSIDAVLRKTRKFYSREISWSLVPADDPDQAFASLCDQGMLIEEIKIPAREGNVAGADFPVLTWPRLNSVSRSLPGPPIRIVVISDTHSQHKRIPLV